MSGEGTSLSERVYDLLRQIPQGYVVSYAGLAAAAGCASPRAIGQILRRNPHAPEVPCHRVIRSDGCMGGYAGATGGASLRRKRELLRVEGVVFERGKLLDPSRFWQFPENRQGGRQ